MKITVNPDTKASTFGYAAEGEYELRVSSCIQKKKQGGEHPYLEWKFEYADKDVRTVEEGTQLGSIFEITTLRPDAQFALRNITDALGVEWGNFDTEEVKGLKLKAKVTVGENNGKKRNEVARFIPA